MFREMKEEVCSRSYNRAEEMLKANDYGILSVNGDLGYPYGVPVGYVYRNEKIYILSPRDGHRIEAIRKNPQVCFTVVSSCNHLLQEDMEYESVIVFGSAYEISDMPETAASHEHLMSKYEGTQSFDRENSTMVKIHVDYISAKGK